jgi:hypothetical protein
MTKREKSKAALITVVVSLSCAVVGTAGGMLRSHDNRLTKLEDHAPTVEWREEVLQRLARIEAKLE